MGRRCLLPRRYGKAADADRALERQNLEDPAQPEPRHPGRALRSGCYLAKSAWAVGSGNGGGLIEHWNGKTWKIQPSPNPGTKDALVGVAATSAKNAWAVGSRGGSGNHFKTLIEHSSGKAWKIQASPNRNRLYPNTLSGVAATSSENAWAAGSYTTLRLGGPNKTLALHWDGSAWKG